jgi:hypothetical protein
MPAGDMATGRGVKDHREAMDLFEKGYRLYGALYDGMEDPIRLKKASEIERFDPENLWAVPSKKIAAAISVRNMPASDTDYLSAVQTGDTKAAQRMVDEAAKAAGYTVGPVFHGRSTEFNTFKMPEKGERALFFSDSPEEANRFPMLRGRRPLEPVSAYLSGNLKQVKYPKDSEGSFLYDPDVMGKLLETARREGFDGVEIDGIQNFEGGPLSTTYAVFKQSQAKLADAVTENDAGNVIPLSQRFKATSEDIRYMPETIQREVGRNQDFATPPTDSEAIDALSSEKKAKFGAARSIKPGTQVAARIDIPAFLRTGKYVVAVHEPDGAAGGPGKVIGYDTVTRLQNPKFVVKPGVQRIYEGKSAKFPVATVDGKIMADRSIPGDLENYVPVGMDPKEHAYFYDKRTDQPVIGGSESVSVGNTVFVKNPVYGKPEDFRYMPSPDSAMPGAYSFPGGYRALPGKAKGSLRIYGPAGSLIGIASSLDEAQRIIRKKSKQ